IPAEVPSKDQSPLPLAAQSRDRHLARASSCRMFSRSTHPLFLFCKCRLRPRAGRRSPMEFEMQCTARNIPRRLSFIANLMIATLLLVQPELAMAQFEKVTSGLDTFKAWLWLIIPVAALCIAGILGLLYSAEVIRKDTLI